MKYVEWVEPGEKDSLPVFCCMPADWAIVFQHHYAVVNGRSYPTDQDALQDFLVIHWATEQDY